MEEILRQKSKELSKSLSIFAISGAKNVREYTIKCSDLDERFLTDDIRYSPEFKDMFRELMKIDDSPCIYCFEIVSKISSEEIVNKMKVFSENPKFGKITPSIKSHYPKNTKTLYVGKVNNNICGRLITHLGFHTQVKNGNRVPSINHGLQLSYWAEGLSLKFKVLQFEQEMINLLGTLETELAAELNPAIGKHK